MWTPFIHVNDNSINRCLREIEYQIGADYQTLSFPNLETFGCRCPSRLENIHLGELLSARDCHRDSIQVDFGDGIAVSYVNLSSMEDGIKHVYHNVGIFRVTVQVDNSLGSDSAVLYLHVTCMLLLLLVYDIFKILHPFKV